jgi:demethylmenaquinone methyltransferase/2-methoxy-6-polyprenyl-1,4-benzoquinol methylase
MGPQGPRSSGLPEPDAPLPRGEEKTRSVQAMFDTIGARYDLVNRVMTFGMDLGWRRRTVAELRLPGRSLVLDLACGTGDLCRELTARGYRAVGFDFSFGMLSAARTSSPLVQGDILRLPVADGTADGVTCGFALRNVVSLEGFFAELKRVVRRGGRIGLLDASRPDNRALRAGHALYFEKAVPLIGGLLSDRRAYAYLPRSMAYLPPPEELLGMLRESGFADATRHQLSGGLSQLYTGTRA